MAAHDQNQTWTRFVLWAVCTIAGVFGVLVTGLYLIDPYDTGRSPFSKEPSLQGQKAIYTVASVGRNPKYTGAIVGNSTIALIEPARLASRTGIPFAQLSLPGVQVREQLTVIDWFMRHHEGSAKALIVSINRDTWCTRDPKLLNANPFPFWRFSRDPLEYTAGLVSLSSVEQAFRRVVAGKSTKSAASDGFWDYEPMYKPLLANPRRQQEILFKKLNDQSVEQGATFPAADALEAALAPLPGGLPIVLVFPPVFSAKQPQPGTPRASAEMACRQRFLDLASRRPNTAVVDWWLDRPELADTASFIDQIHYRHAIARRIEEDIASALKAMRRNAASPPSVGEEASKHSG